MARNKVKTQAVPEGQPSDEEVAAAVAFFETEADIDPEDEVPE